MWLSDLAIPTEINLGLKHKIYRKGPGKAGCWIFFAVVYIGKANVFIYLPPLLFSCYIFHIRQEVNHDPTG